MHVIIAAYSPTIQMQRTVENLLVLSLRLFAAADLSRYFRAFSFAGKR
ncbi:hypothetical protein [Leptothermofonsia sp. ETS-13]